MLDNVQVALDGFEIIYNTASTADTEISVERVKEDRRGANNGRVTCK